MLSNSVVSGGFALLLLYLTAMHVGSQPAMLYCVICGLTSWAVNVAQDADNRYLSFGLSVLAVGFGALAVMLVASKVLLP